MDINPVQNPYIREGVIQPPASAGYVDRTAKNPGMILGDGPVVAAFRAAGWSWGGDWTELLDYQHFYKKS